MLEQILYFGRVDQGFPCPTQLDLHILRHNRGGHERTASIRGQDNGVVRCPVPTVTGYSLLLETDGGVETLYHDPIFRRPETEMDIFLRIQRDDSYMCGWRGSSSRKITNDSWC